MISDTSPEAERVFIELWRQLTPGERVRRALHLSSMVMRMSRQALKRRRPDLSEREIDLWWVELNYGRELAHGLRGYLEQHDAPE